VLSSGAKDIADSPAPVWGFGARTTIITTKAVSCNSAAGYPSTPYRVHALKERRKREQNKK